MSDNSIYGIMTEELVIHETGKEEADIQRRFRFTNDVSQGNYCT